MGFRKIRVLSRERTRTVGVLVARRYRVVLVQNGRRLGFDDVALLPSSVKLGKPS